MTKFNLKTLVVAVALAATAGQANAAMVNSQGIAGDGNSSVMMYAWSTLLGRSYSRDLGFNLKDFLYNGSTAPTAGSLPFNPAATPVVSAGNATTIGYALNFGTDSLMTSWLGNGTTLASDVKWGVAAVDGQGTGANFRALTTVEAGKGSAGTINAELYTFENKFDNFIAAHNQLGTHWNDLGVGGGIYPPTGNGSAGSDGSNGLGADATAWFGMNWTGATNFFTAGDVGQSMEFFYLGANGTLGSTNATSVRYGKGNPSGLLADASGGFATWKLNNDGSLAYAASAVPVPAAVWLFASGLMGLVGISRRKKSA